MAGRKPWWLWVAGIIGAIPLCALALFEVSKAECFSLTGQAMCRVETKQPLVAITFDDGPTALGLDAVLPLLKRYDAKGTFFLVGQRVTRPLVQRIVADRHEIGNHSFHHEWMVLRTPSYYDEEIRSTDAALVAAGAPEPKVFRPPYGKKLIGLPLAIERSGKRMIMWDAGDPPDRNPVVYATKVLQRVRPGSIILIHPMHAANATERAALPLILDGISRRGLRMVTVSELLLAAGDQ